MIVYKIFLASSAEMAEERTLLGDIVQEYNDNLAKQNKKVCFSLYKYERDTDSFAEGRKQDEYNHQIANCDIFIMLYSSRIGKFTEEEYDFAYDTFMKNGAPLCYVFKRTGIKVEEQHEVSVFEEKVRSQGQFKSRYENNKDLRNQLHNEWNKLFASGRLKAGVPANTIHSDGQSVPATFKGREEELKIIRERLGQGGKLMLINAEGGIGKTTLAAKYWAESLYDYKHNAWLFCENGIVSELKKLALGLNVDLTRYEKEEEKLDALKKALQNISHDFLLVLDNANNPEHIESFRQAFRGFHWHVLITSRCSGVMDKGQELPITHLPPPLAKELFTSYYREDTPEFEALLDTLLEAIHYHTLLVEVFAKNMALLRQRGEKLADFLTHLQRHGLYLHERSFEIRTDYTHSRHVQAATTDEILDVLYDFSALSEKERYWLVNIALLPATPHRFTFLCKVFKQDKFKFRVLDELSQKGWLIAEEDLFRISPVIQSLLLKKNNASLEWDARWLVDNLNEKLEPDSHGSHLIHFNEASPYVALVESITNHLSKQPFKELFKALYDLNFNASLYFILTGDLNAAQEAATKMKGISEMMNDKRDVVVAHSKLRNIAQACGDMEQAEFHYKVYLQLSEELHHSRPANVAFKTDVANIHSKLGFFYEFYMKVRTKALTSYQKAATIWQELTIAVPGKAEFEQNQKIVLEAIARLENGE